MNALRILDEVKAAGGRVKLTAPDRLRVEAPAPLSPALVEQVKAHKPEIIRYLSAPAPPIIDGEAFDERTAIIMANGVPEEWARGFAMLCTMPRSSAYAPYRWQQLVDDGGHFLDRWGRKAAALGWRAVDVFGVCPDAPENRYDSMGLVPLLQGRHVIAITADTARIDCGAGAHLTFYRQTMAAGVVAVWDLKRHHV
jgi:hypothetical protein